MTDKYTDKEIVDGLIANDENIIRHFFLEKCAPMLGYIIKKVYAYRVERDELVSELFIYLQENNWHKLRQFDFRSKLTTWLSVVAVRFFIKKRNLLIESDEKNTLIDQIKESGYDPVKDMFIKMDVRHALERMPNARYREVLYEWFINGMEPEELADRMNITLANLYNLKLRAVQQIAEIIKKEEGYER